jgi:hypothetical protein
MPPLTAVLAAISVAILVIDNLTGSLALNAGIILGITIHYLSSPP